MRETKIIETPEQRERRLQCLKKYYRKNAEKINKNNIENHKNNPNYNINRNKSYACECGGRTCNSNRSHHYKTPIHLKWVAENTTAPTIIV